MKGWLFDKSRKKAGKIVSCRRAVCQRRQHGLLYPIVGLGLQRGGDVAVGAVVAHDITFFVKEFSFVSGRTLSGETRVIWKCRFATWFGRAAMCT